MPDLSKNNEWLWESRWTHWWFKTATREAENLPAPCMCPAYSGIIDDDRIAQGVEALKRAHINTVLTEGLRRTVRFEHEGLTDQVIEAIRKVTDACHHAGIRVVHHTTTSFADNKLDAFPATYRDWLSIDAQTGAYAYTTWIGGWYFWCINNPDFRREYFRLCTELYRQTGVDGLMVDEVYFRTGWYNCACAHCREKYEESTGFTLASADTASFWGNFDNPAFRAWISFRCASVGDFYEDLYASLKEVAAHPVLLGCKNSEPTPTHNQDYGDSNEERMRGVNLLFIETGSVAFLYSWRRLSFELMAYVGLSNYYNTPTLAITYNPNPHEGFLSWALRVSHGVRVWATSGGAPIGGALGPRAQLLDSPGDMALYRELFGWEEEHREELRGAIQPLASVAVLLSAATRDMSDHSRGWNYYVREIVGWCEALTDEYIQYAVMVEQELVLARLQRYRLVILPNAACLSNKACRSLVDYVAQGGSLVLTSETGLRDETGSKNVGENRLDLLLGVNRGCSADDTPVQFGQLGQGKWAYFADRPGMATYTTTNQPAETRTRDTEDVPCVSQDDQDSQRSLMIQAVKWATEGQHLLTVKGAPDGLLIKAFWQRKGKAALVHLLNCRGEGSVGFGEVIPERYRPRWPALEEDVVLELRSTELKEAYLISPDWPGKKPVRSTPISEGLQLVIPANALKRYAVMYIWGDGE